MTLPSRRTTRPPATPARALSELDGILMDYVIGDPAKPTPRTLRRRAESVDPVQRKWSFERAALRHSLRIRAVAPWYADTDSEHVA